MNDEPSLKPVIFIGSSRKDLREFPEPVQDHIGYNLYVAQLGGKHRDTKTMRGFGGAGVVETITVLWRGHISCGIHIAMCRDDICPSRLPEKIDNWSENTATGHRVD